MAYQVPTIGKPRDVVCYFRATKYIEKQPKNEIQTNRKELQKWGKPIVKSVKGFTKDDLEPLFEKFILPFYYAVCTFPKDINIESKWKIVDRESGIEYGRINAYKELRNIGVIN